MINKSKTLSFPKIQKSIQDFISNESWSISTKWALIVWATWVMALWINDAVWICDINPSGHFNWNTNGHYNGSWTFWAAVSNIPSGSCSGANVNYNYNSWCTSLTCTDVSWVVNGHYNITPTCNSTPISQHCNHSSSWSWSWSWGWDSCG